MNLLELLKLLTTFYTNNSFTLTANSEEVELNIKLFNESEHEDALSEKSRRKKYKRGRRDEVKKRINFLKDLLNAGYTKKSIKSEYQKQFDMSNSAFSRDLSKASREILLKEEVDPNSRIQKNATEEDKINFISTYLRTDASPNVIHQDFETRFGRDENYFELLQRAREQLSESKKFNQRADKQIVFNAKEKSK